MSFKTNSPQETRQFAEKFAKTLNPSDIICLDGNLGAGKTTFAQGLVRGLGGSDTTVNSPTFTVMNVYDAKRCPVYHFDLYRLEGNEQIALIGYEEFLYGDGISLVEWPERLGSLMPDAYLHVKIETISETERQISVEKITP